MPDSGDRNIGNKLKDFSVPYEPADWAAMEQRLDEKPKRGFLWLWWAAIPIFLLGAGGLIWTLSGTNDTAISQYTVEPNQTQQDGNDITSMQDRVENLSSEEGSNLLAEEVNDEVAPISQVEENSSSSIPNTEVADGLGTAKPQINTLETLTDEEPHDMLAFVENPNEILTESSIKESIPEGIGGVEDDEEVAVNANSQELHFSDFPKVSSKVSETEPMTIDRLEVISEVGTHDAQEEQMTSTLAEPVESFEESEVQEANSLPASSIPAVVDEQSEHMESVEQSEEVVATKTDSSEIPDEAQLLEDDEAEPEKKTPKKVHIRMGFSIAMLQSFTSPASFTTTGFDAGYSLELMIKKKAAINSGFGYSIQHYRVTNANCDGTGLYQCPEAYKSTVKTFTIPISLQYNYLRKEKWSAYARFGMIHNIKRQEKFHYDFTYIPLDTSQPPPPPPPPPPPATLASYESFIDTKDEAALQSAGANFSNLPSDAVSDFAISGYKRYHFSVLIGTGIEYRVKRLTLQSELNYAFATGKIGIQETRLNSLSLKGGILFRIGRE